MPIHSLVHRQAAENVHIPTAFKDSIDFIKKIYLYENVGDYTTKETFYVDEKLAVNILLKASFIDMNILGILPQ